MTNWLIIAVITGVIGLAMVARVYSGRSGKSVRYPYQKQTTLFGPDDRAFFQALKAAVGDDYEVFGKMRVADILVLKKGHSKHDAHNVFNPIAGRHFDFVLLEKKNLAIACAIQLQDKTNPTVRQSESNDPLKSICEAVSLPYVRFYLNAQYPRDEVRDRLQQAMTKEPFYLTETDGRKEPRISSLENMKF